MTKQVEKEIEFYIEVLKLLIVVLIATAGSAVGLLYKLSNPVTLPLLFIGLWIIAVSLIGIGFVVFRIRELIGRFTTVEIFRTKSYIYKTTAPDTINLTFSRKK